MCPGAHNATDPNIAFETRSNLTSSINFGHQVWSGQRLSSDVEVMTTSLQPNRQPSQALGLHMQRSGYFTKMNCSKLLVVSDN
jgi:hypothetical protein